MELPTPREPDEQIEGLVTPPPPTTKNLGQLSLREMWIDPRLIGYSPASYIRRIVGSL